MGEPLWKIEGFVTAAGNCLVQEWFWDEIGVDERDAIRDRMNHLVNLGRNLWMEPYFKWLGDIGEVRVLVSGGALRIYGYFPSDTSSFVFLNGVVKKRNKDREGIDLARKRLQRLNNGEGYKHDFDFSERPSEEASEGK